MPPLFAIPFPTIDPNLIVIGPFAIRWYALAYVFGLIGAWLYAKRLAANDALWGGRKRPSALDIDDLLVFAAFGVVLGGRLAYVIFYNPAFFLANPAEIPAIWRGGMSFHGGLLGAMAAMAWLARKRDVPVLSVFDLIAPAAPIGLFLGRIANFINAELWGRVTDVPWGVIFPNAGPLPRHPSQLYEAAAEGLLLFVILAALVRMGGLSRPGLAAGVFGAGYAIARIGCEFFREPDPQLGFIAGGFLTMGMLLSLPMLAAGVWLILRARRAPA